MPRFSLIAAIVVLALNASAALAYNKAAHMVCSISLAALNHARLHNEVERRKDDEVASNVRWQARNSSRDQSVLSDLPRLHRSHRVQRLLSSFEPPLASGTRWST